MARALDMTYLVIQIRTFFMFFASHAEEEKVLLDGIKFCENICFDFFPNLYSICADE